MSNTEWVSPQISRTVGTARCAVRDATPARSAAARRPYQILGQQIVSARTGNTAANEFAYRRRFRQNDPRIDIWGVRFTAGHEGLIDEQLHFASNFLARHFTRDPLLHK